MSIFNKKKEEKEFGEAYLMTVSNEVKLAMVEGILENEGIPFFKKHLDAGGVALAYGSFFNQSIEIYVPVADLQKAKDAIQSNMDAVGEDMEEEIDEALNDAPGDMDDMDD